MKKEKGGADVLIPYLLYFVGAFIFSIILHEVAHGVMALRFGDTTAKDAGRITLNPLPHIDKVGTIIVPGILLLIRLVLGVGFVIGWAKPVPVNPLRFSRYRAGMFWVSAAGVVTNLTIAVTLGLILRFFADNTSSLLFVVLFPWVWANIIFGLFNLVPVPPLDGSKIASAVLNFSFEQQLRFERMVSRFWFVMLIGLFIALPLIFKVLSALFAALTGFSLSF